MIRRLDRATLRRGEVVPLAAERPARDDQALTDEALHRRVCRLLAAQMAVTPENFRALIDDALARLSGASTVTLRVHPDDQASLAPPALLAARHRVGLPELVADASVSRGGCIVQSDQGTLDATIEARVTRALEGGAWT